MEILNQATAVCGSCDVPLWTRLIAIPVALVVVGALIELLPTKLNPWRECADW